MKSLKFENTRRIDVVGFAILGGLTLTALLEVIQPQLQIADVVVAQRIALNEQRGKISDLNAETELAKKRLHTLQQTIDKGPYKLQSAKQVNQRLVELTDLVTREGLMIRNLQPGATTSLPRFQIVEIDLSGTGSYRSAASFLHRLHEVFPDMGVNSFELSVEQSDAGVAMTYHFNLAWFVRPISANSK